MFKEHLLEKIGSSMPLFFKAVGWSGVIVVGIFTKHRQHVKYVIIILLMMFIGGGMSYCLKQNLFEIITSTLTFGGMTVKSLDVLDNIRPKKIINLLKKLQGEK